MKKGTIGKFCMKRGHELTYPESIFLAAELKTECGETRVELEHQWEQYCLVLEREMVVWTGGQSGAGKKWVPE